MAECSYARCVQQRRNIRRDLQRWTKNMVHIVGLERIAEELMGRRKWKLYQESMSRSYLQPLNNNIKRTSINQLIDDECYQHKENNNKTSLPDSELAKTESNTALRREGGENDIESANTQQKENEKTEIVEDRLKDWSPQTKCYFCVDGKLDSEHNSHGVLSPRNSDSDSSDSHSDGEGVPKSLTSSAARPPHLNNHHHHRQPSARPAVPNMTTIDNVSVAALAVAALSGGGTAPAPHLPFYAPNMLTQNWYLANVARTFQNATTEVDKASSGGEQPLDLSKGASTNSSGTEPKIHVGNNVNVRLPTLDTKHIFNSDFRAKPRMSAVAGRRTYTEDELQAALRDIQSGKLGTRRAAVIYGIPRSTLRNKVYKLALERERESHIESMETHLNTSTPLKIDEDEAMDDDKELSGTEEEKEVEKALSAPLLSMADIIRFSGIEHPPDALKLFLQKSKEGQDAWSPGVDHSEVAPYIQALLASQNLLASQKPPDGVAAPAPTSVLSHIIPEFMKRIMEEEQLLKMRNNNGDSERLTRPSPSNSVTAKSEKTKSESDMESEETTSNVILKIPSFKPTSNKNGCDLFGRSGGSEAGRLVSPPVTSDSGSPPILPGKGLLIKDAIAQSISQKFQQSLEPVRRPIMEMDFKRGGFTPPLVSGVPSVIKTQHEINARSYPPPQKPQNLSGSGSTSTGGKGTRPKRGKYRNYDRDSLVEAVRAVQRGEMSVHRAGSYYGVPHSTLEYKVKERHLMRPRKRDPKPNPVDEKIASLKQNDLRNSQVAMDKMKPTTVMKPPQKFSPTSPNGMKLPIFEPPGLPGYNHPPFPFWPHPGFPHLPIEYAARNPTSPFSTANQEFFASQMMQKLQEESSRSLSTPGGSANAATLVKSARQMAESLLEGSGSNGSFLDGIIRSSLESGVPSDDKSPKEEKNVAPENMSNKALLDQLCRNSRLTPLSKPNADANSSGDESYRKGSSPLNFSTGMNNGSTNQDESTDRSPSNSKDTDMQTIELSNDSNDSSERKSSMEEASTERKHPRIYLKQDLVKPENLKPEMLVRFRQILPMEDRNGENESMAGSSASDNEALQD